MHSVFGNVCLPISDHRQIHILSDIFTCKMNAICANPRITCEFTSERNATSIKDRGLIIITCSQWLNYEGRRSTWLSRKAY